MKWASSFLFYLEYLKLKLGLGWEIVEKWVGGLAVQCWGGGRGPFFFLQSNGFFFFFFCSGHGPPKPLCGSTPTHNLLISCHIASSL